MSKRQLIHSATNYNGILPIHSINFEIFTEICQYLNPLNIAMLMFTSSYLCSLVINLKSQILYLDEFRYDGRIGNIKLRLAYNDELANEAAQIGDLNLYNYALTLGAKLSYPNMAVEHGHFDMESKIDGKYSSKWTYAAVARGRYDILRLDEYKKLLLEEENVEENDEENDEEKTERIDLQSYAVMVGNIDMIKHLRDNGFPVRADFMYQLFLEGNTEMIEFLHSEGIRYDYTNRMDFVELCSEKITKEQNRGISLLHKYGYDLTPLIAASIQRNNIEKLEVIYNIRAFNLMDLAVVLASGDYIDPLKWIETKHNFTEIELNQLKLSAQTRNAHQVLRWLAEKNVQLL